MLKGGILSITICKKLNNDRFAFGKFCHNSNFCVTACHICLFIVRTRLSRLVLLAAIESLIGHQIPYVEIAWLLFCVLDAISRPIDNQRNQVTSGIFGVNPMYTVLESLSSCRNLVRIMTCFSLVRHHFKCSRFLCTCYNQFSVGTAKHH